jgi:hypothetical protein
MDSAQISKFQADCGTYLGTYAAGACDRTGAVSGYCLFAGAAFTAYYSYTIPGAIGREYYYTAGAWTAATAQSFCQLPPAGVWTVF